jgi:hypothetical protein
MCTPPPSGTRASRTRTPLTKVPLRLPRSRTHTRRWCTSRRRAGATPRVAHDDVAVVGRPDHRRPRTRRCASPRCRPSGAAARGRPACARTRNRSRGSACSSSPIDAITPPRRGDPTTLRARCVHVGQAAVDPGGRARRRGHVDAQPADAAVGAGLARGGAGGALRAGRAPKSLVHVEPLAQTFPQAPQLLGSLRPSMQRPAHARGVFEGHAQAPLTQLVPPPHEIPQAPQLRASLRTSTQEPLQRVVPSSTRPSQSSSRLLQVSSPRGVHAHTGPRPGSDEQFQEPGQSAGPAQAREQRPVGRHTPLPQSVSRVQGAPTVPGPTVPASIPPPPPASTLTPASGRTTSKEGSTRSLGAPPSWPSTPHTHAPATPSAEHTLVPPRPSTHTHDDCAPGVHGSPASKGKVPTPPRGLPQPRPRRVIAAKTT